MLDALEVVFRILCWIGRALDILDFFSSSYKGVRWLTSKNYREGVQESDEQSALRILVCLAILLILLILILLAASLAF